MMRLPQFTYLAPRSLSEVADLLAEHQPDVMVVAGGTDLLPSMKRRQRQPRTVIGLRRVPELRGVSDSNDGSLRIGAMATLETVARDPRVRGRYPALSTAASLGSTPHLRLMGTIGGNLCLDTRCTYYDQGEQWRSSISFCMKCPSTNPDAICWVAPGSSRCWAINSSDTSPVVVALRAQLRLVSASGERWVDADAFFHDDGIQPFDRRPDEILAEVRLPPLDGWHMTYLKVRRRGSFDFPVLSVAAAVKRTNGMVEDARLVLGAVGSAPLDASAAAATLVGTMPTQDALQAVGALAARGARPLDNTDLNYAWRKKIARVYVARALAQVCSTSL